jgi:predicted lysophospholipase L1 biosynthesis ABC-type transport system permease subunit
MRPLGNRNLIWRDGRFSWPFVAMVAYLAIALFLFDLMWRISKTPFAQFLMISGAAFAVTLLVLLFAIRFASRPPAPK